MKKLAIILIVTTHFCIAQTYKQEIVSGVTEETQGLRIELKNPTPINSYNAALKAYNNNTTNGYGILAGSASPNGSGVHGTSTLGYGVTGYTGAPSVFGLYFPGTGTTTTSGVLGLGTGNYIGVKGFSENNTAGFFATTGSNIQLIVKKIATLAIGVTSSINFQIDSWNTGAIKTIGQDANKARMGFFTFASSDASTLQERISILDDGKVGVGLISPNDILDINGRTRIRHNVNTAGIWMSNASNGLTLNDGAFFGLENGTAGSERAGIWVRNAWRFYVDRSGNTTVGGGISVGGGETIAKIIKTTVSHDLPLITAGSSIESNIPVAGVVAGDVAIVNIDGVMGLLVLNNVRIVSSNFVTVSIYNASAASLDRGPMDFRIVVFK